MTKLKLYRTMMSDQTVIDTVIITTIKTTIIKDSILKPSFRAKTIAHNHGTEKNNTECKINRHRVIT